MMVSKNNDDILDLHVLSIPLCDWTHTSVLCFALSTLDFSEGPPILISFPFGLGHRKPLYQTLCRWLDDILTSTLILLK